VRLSYGPRGPRHPRLANPRRVNVPPPIRLFKPPRRPNGRYLNGWGSNMNLGDIEIPEVTGVRTRRIAALQRIADLARRIAATIREVGGSTRGSNTRMRAISDKDKLLDIRDDTSLDGDVRREARYTVAIAIRALDYGAVQKDWAQEALALDQLEQRAAFTENWWQGEAAAIAAAQRADEELGITSRVQQLAQAEQERLRLLCSNPKEEWLLRAAKMLPGTSAGDLAHQYELTCQKDLGWMPSLPSFAKWAIVGLVALVGLRVVR